MKKFFTLLCASFCALITVEAQTLQFVDDEGKNVENGATVYFGKYDPEYEEYDKQYAFFSKFALILLSEDNKDIKTPIAVEVKSLDESEIGFCAFGGCRPTNSENDYTVLKNAEILPGKNISLDIEYLGKPGELDIIITKKIQITAWIPGKEADKISATLVITNDENLLSVEGVQATSLREVKVNGNVLTYNFSTTAPRMFSLYSLDGSKAMSQLLVEAQGNVSLSTLSAGMYLYCIEDAKGKVCGKAVIKK